MPIDTHHAEAGDARGEQCHHPKAHLDERDVRVVRDVMVARPKTLPADATVADLRRLFENTHVISALLVDGTAFAGAVHRDGVPADAPDTMAARDLARRDVPTARRDTPVKDAMAQLDATGTFRAVVLDDDGVTLAGLVCLDQPRTGFCQ
jgi:predicted transcriptional regulator